MTYYNQTDCLNTCSNGYCNYTYSYSYKRYMYNCVQNPSGVYNTLSNCNNSCSSGYCNQTYNSYHSRYEYNCTPNDAGVYNSYYSCNNNCYDGYCDTTYSYSLSRFEYTCTKLTQNSNIWYFLLLLIPIFAILFISTINYCQKKRRAAKSILKQASKIPSKLVIQSTILPNSQLGLYIPLTLEQHDKQNQKMSQVQIYQPQPIYIPQPILIVHNAPQFQIILIPDIYLAQMPIMPQ
ncbi:Hypothetical_protein [Hexamita inflata]|uniref:Hypothetical_protein n=1 Tax=Hexamita inflata TaxID=28002 RepID=A0AA86Q5R7_9EUKA|nr:Hypothetical protein HINF_LOCUS38711 [Hexamita inflata]